MRNLRAELRDLAQQLVDLHTGGNGQGEWNGLLSDLEVLALWRNKTPGFRFHDMSTVDGEAWCETCRVDGDVLRWDWKTGKQRVIE